MVEASAPYLSIAEAAELAGLPIGPDRKLTVFEHSDMNLAGLKRADIAEMTPEVLADHGDFVADTSHLLVGH